MTGRALITGAGGFVGQRLAFHLRASGWEVLCSGYPPADDMFTCDVRDRASVEELARQAGELTHVFHLAAIAFVPDAERDPALAIEVNLKGTINLCEILRQVAHPPRFIYIGSADAYGPPCSLPVTEGHPLRPANVYAISKAAADQYCARFSRHQAFECVRLRPFNHTGPGQPDYFVLSSFARQIAEIEIGERAPAVKVGNLEAARDFLHVDDVIRAYELAARNAVPGEVYNICSGKAFRIQDALDRLIAMSAVPIEIQLDPQRMRPSDVPEMRGSHDKFTTATGWRPEIDFETILRGLLAYWRDVLTANNPRGAC